MIKIVEKAAAYRHGKIHDSSGSVNPGFFSTIQKFSEVVLNAANYISLQHHLWHFNL